MGPDSPCSPPVYTHKYAYRGLIPMERARKELGDDLAQNAKMHMGQDGHVLTFPGRYPNSNENHASGTG